MPSVVLPSVSITGTGLFTPPESISNAELAASLTESALKWNAEHAEEISGLGKDLYERLCTMFEHLDELRGRLDSAVQAHNAAIGSLESRVLPAARRFKDLGVVSAKDMPEPGPIDHLPRRIQAPEAGEPPRPA